jgi:hypothetical protein
LFKFKRENSLFVIEQPPRLRALRNGAIFLLPQPLLLCQGGESAHLNIADSCKLPKRVCQSIHSFEARNPQRCRPFFE